MKILTPSGYSYFKGIRKTTKNEYIHLIFSDGNEIKCTFDHKIKTPIGWKEAHTFLEGDEVLSKTEILTVIYFEPVFETHDFYDILDVNENNEYFTNGVISHNCEFVGGANTLISASKLKSMTWIDPIKAKIEIDGLSTFSEPQKDRLYSITCDTSRGVGADYSAFIVVDVTSYPHTIVATYKSNKLSAFYYPTIIKTVGEYYNQAMVLIETNDLGESVAQALYDDFEYENILTTMTKERKGTVLSASFGPMYRLGVKTMKNVKGIGCTNLKTMIETDKLMINDHAIFHELNNFVSNGKSYAAIDGEHDDLAMCCVLHAWMATQEYFKGITDSDFRSRVMQDAETQMDNTMLPFGFIATGHEEDDDGMGSFF